MVQGLNEAQARAVGILRGPVLILAGAGTGKTRVITYRIANLIQSGITPERILAVTFTNKAAREMRDRCLARLGQRIDRPPIIATFHSFCVQLLRRHAERIGYPRDFLIYDREDQENVARQVLRELKVEGKSLRPSALLARISDWKLAGLEPAPALDAASERDEVAAIAYRRYQESLRGSAALDFDDLLFQTVSLLASDIAVRALERDRFDHVLVDEYQDTSPSQYQILKYLTERHQNLCVVGDDDQSIYSWRGAEIQNILDFERDFPSTQVIRLEENYRSCPKILRTANRLIQFNRQRHPKELRGTRPEQDGPSSQEFSNEVTEATGVARDILQVRLNRGLSFRDFAVLFRTNEQPRIFETEFRALGVPYRLVGSFSFFSRREVRDVLAYLRVLAQPRDEESLKRVLKVPARGLGDAVLAKLLSRATKAGVPMWDILSETAESGLLRPPAAQSLSELVDLVVRYRARAALPRTGSPTAPLADLLLELLKEIDYLGEIRKNYDEAKDQESRWASVVEVVNMLSRYEQRASEPSLAGFLETVALEQREQERDESEKDRDSVTLMTLHAAKGLEFPHVYLVGLEQRILPHERNLDSPDDLAEERRLAYVGITRARDRLVLTRAKTRTRFGQPVPSCPSQFLWEMKGETPPDLSEWGKPAAAKKTPSARGFHRHQIRR